MVAGTIVAICQFGGEFIMKDDETMSYTGGEAHAINISHDMLHDDFKSELVSMFKIDSSSMCIHYLLPVNKRTLITVSSDKDFERMIEFNVDSLTMDIFVSSKGDRSITSDSGTSVVDTAAADRRCRPRRANIVRPNSTDKIGKRASGGKFSVADSSTPKTASGIISGNVKQKKRKAAEETVIRNVDDSVTPAATTPTVNANTQERLESYEVDHLDKNRVILNNIDEADEVNPDLCFSLNTADDIGSLQSTNDWTTVITDVGQEFDNVKLFRGELWKYAFAGGFKLNYINNDKKRVTAECTSENCPWRIHASQSSHKQKFIIKKFNKVHKCAAKVGEDGHRRARKLYFASIVRNKVLDNPDCRPRDIARDLYEEYGIHLSYTRAWHAKESAQKEIHMLQQEACNQLPWLCEQIMGSNPGSVTVLATSADAKFRRCFISLYALLNGFEHGCRPLLFLDRMSLKANIYWKLLVAASVDGDNKIFPVAFATVEDETPESWHWFLEQLKHTTTSSKITIVSSRQQGLDELVPRVFDDCYHSYSLFHLIEDFKAVLKKGSWSTQQKNAMVGHLKCAAHAYLVDEYNANMDKINEISEDVGKWVLSTKPDSWSNALFKGACYDHLSSNITDCLSKWITVNDESSAVQILHALLMKTIDVIYSRKQASSSWDGTLTPSMETTLQKEMSRAHNLNVICSTETIFEVRCSTINVVDIGNWECTCRRWQITGMPCVHAIAVSDRIGRSVYDYCSKFFRRESYVATYSMPIQPIADISLMQCVVRSASYPPPTNRPPERRKRKRRNPHKISFRPLRCSRCKVIGHNKATCDVPLVG